MLDALASLRQRYDVVLCEGAGSPTEINLLDRDIVNLRAAADAGLPSIVVGDINPGGVYAASTARWRCCPSGCGRPCVAW